MSTKKATDSKFVKLLTRDNSKVQKARAVRLGTITEAEMDQLISNLETQRLTIEDQLDQQLDVTTQNDMTSMNAIKDWDAKAFIKSRVEMRVKLKNLDINIEAALETQKELFG